MVLRARLNAPVEERNEWPWHELKWTTLSASLLMRGERRMEAENYLAGGYGLRLALEEKKHGRCYLGDIARIWQPSRLKGIQVSPRFGTPFLAATQVFDLRPTPRKYLSLDRTENSAGRFVTPGQILVTCSGTVGRATLAHRAHERVLISHDLLRVESHEPSWWGWIYAFLRTSHARAMMSAAQYGHIIKHLEVSHLSAIPVPRPRLERLEQFQKQAQDILARRNDGIELLREADEKFATAVGPLPEPDSGEEGFVVTASRLFQGRRRLEGSFHVPTVQAIRSHHQARNARTEKLSDAGFSVWLPNRFKRIDAQHGVELLDSSDLFEINPDVSRRIADEGVSGPNRGRVIAGWLLVARSGQAYGLNGSVTIATAYHEGKVVSDDVIRVVPREGCSMRAGYLFVALSHPTLGRPLVKALIYGSSIPHLDVSDLSNLEVVRLSEAEENDIADSAERGARLLAEADILENRLAADAEGLVDQFLAGETRDIVVL